MWSLDYPAGGRCGCSEGCTTEKGDFVKLNITMLHFIYEKVVHNVLSSSPGLLRRHKLDCYCCWFVVHLASTDPIRIHQYFHVSLSPEIVWDQTGASPPARVGVPLTP